MSTSVLPSTYNALAPDERDRLMRSTRKLGSILGTTPHLVEDAGSSSLSPSQSRPSTSSSTSSSRLPTGSQISRTESPSLASAGMRSHRREARIFGHGMSDSMASRASLELARELKDAPTSPSRHKPSLSLAGSTGRLRQDAPAPLLLRLQPATDIHYAPRSPGRPSSAPATPNSASFDPSTPLTPLTPMQPQNVPPQELRRKKMAKLARTLGENVPPSLVFGETDGPYDEDWLSNTPHSRRRSRSVSDMSAALSAWTLPGDEQAPAVTAHKPQVVSEAQPPPPAPAFAPAPAPPRATTPPPTPSPALAKRRSTSKLQRSRSAAASKPRARAVPSRSAAPMSWAIDTPMNAPMPWTEPFLKDSLAQMPPADRPFQSGVPILPQDPSFPRPPGENFMTPAEERRRREKEWSGEWNMDIDAVRSRLRNLK